YAHTLIACKSLLKGFGKVNVNKAAIEEDLGDNWAVVAEAIQTILRREAYPNPYEALKALTRTGEKMNPEAIARFIEGLDVSENLKKELRTITPYNYTGVVKEF
ncbi:MAG TPA: adenylosuccinate lyase, partial [Chitinophagaceae bacterium]|nr:adenylosuccinate lyase [Chitinophagaceae bacterium]